MEGRLSSRTYQTQSGETRHSNDINITDVQFLGQRSDRLEDVVVAPDEYQEAEAAAFRESPEWQGGAGDLARSHLARHHVQTMRPI